MYVIVKDELQGEKTVYSVVAFLWEKLFLQFIGMDYDDNLSRDSPAGIVE